MHHRSHIGKFAIVALLFMSQIPLVAQGERWKQLSARAQELRQQGRHSEAIIVAKEAADVAETTFGAEDPTTATALDSLALLCQEEGKYAEAEQLYKRSLAIYEAALGPDDRDVATSLNNLGLLYEKQGRSTEAELLYKRALTTYEKALGADHHKR